MMPRITSLQSVRSLAATVLAKDGATAEHQEKAGALAYRIGRRLGLSRDVVMGTYLGGLLHDIGKIAVPTAVLLKPAPLTANERTNIKKHPQGGYDILKHINFDWPVADIVLQHHERLDGTGYPHGLTNGAICMEARILAVADIVDAFASHRPYITDSSMAALIKLLRAERELRLDSEVVDACLWIMDRSPHLVGRAH